AIASAALRTEASQCVRVEEGRLFPGDYIERYVLLLTSKKQFIFISDIESKKKHRENDWFSVLMLF
ncbi:hypothetical protein AAAT95_00940, partial [Hominifimenecus microfluidus]